ncbi:MAG TPA: SOS response-associated peptidase [Xanthomonadaceae bacterium]|nr:SOS response-associated peptidase [Xanthomonadaceae bacterium]
MHRIVTPMCGRYFLNTLPEALSAQFELTRIPVYEARFNIAPTQHVPVIRETDGERTVDALRWGLVPGWAKDIDIGSRMINARTETVTGKPAFRNAWRARRRCIVPASGFYEWKGDKPPKQPFAIVPKDGGCFALAGLWEHWQRDDAEPVETFTILTRDADEGMRDLHARMPVMLPRHLYGMWLHGPAEAAASVLALPNEVAVHAWPVSRGVNNVRRDDAGLIEPMHGADRYPG